MLEYSAGLLYEYDIASRVLWKIIYTHDPTQTNQPTTQPQHNTPTYYYCQYLYGSTTNKALSLGPEVVKSVFLSSCYGATPGILFCVFADDLNLENLFFVLYEQKQYYL